PAETWAAIKAEYLAGREPLTDIARRHGVLCSAAHNRRYAEKWDALRAPAPRPLPFRPTRSLPACPSCGWGARIVGGLNFTTRMLPYECSACGEGFEQPFDLRRRRRFRASARQLRVIQGGRTC